jgi:hypothetical protein
VLAPHRQSVNVGGVPVDTLIRLGVIGVLVSAVAMAASFRAQTPLALRSIEAEATQFKVTMSDGRVLRSPQLVGAARLVAIGAETRRLRIDAVETDPGDPQKGRQPAPNVFLHTLSVEAADGSWQNICLPGPDDRRQAFPLAGRAAPDATIQPPNGARSKSPARAAPRANACDSAMGHGKAHSKTHPMALHPTISTMPACAWCGPIVPVTEEAPSATAH